jgi:hypothetical protein
LKRLAAPIALVILVASLGPMNAVTAVAQSQNVHDPKDSHGLFDIARIEVRGKRYRPRFEIFTYTKWTNRRAEDKGFMIVELDTFGDGHFNYYVLVRSVGSRLEASVFRQRKNKPDFVALTIDAWRGSGKSIAFRVPLRRLKVGDKRTYYRWFAKSLFTNVNCQSVCIDRAPDDGFVRQILIPEIPEPTPTPVVTPSPPPATPTPSPSSSHPGQGGGRPSPSPTASP